MSDKQYQPNEIPKKFDGVVYTHYCYHSDYSWHTGKIVHAMNDMSGDSYICIAQTPVHITVPEHQKDLKKMVLEALETEKKKQMAEYHEKMFRLQEKIDALLCLEYKPVMEAEIIETANDLPF